MYFVGDAVCVIYRGPLISAFTLQCFEAIVSASGKASLPLQSPEVFDNNHGGLCSGMAQPTLAVVNRRPGTLTE